MIKRKSKGLLIYVKIKMKKNRISNIKKAFNQEPFQKYHTTVKVTTLSNAFMCCFYLFFIIIIVYLTTPPTHNIGSNGTLKCISSREIISSHLNASHCLLKNDTS